MAIDENAPHHQHELTLTDDREEWGKKDHPVESDEMVLESAPYAPETKKVDLVGLSKFIAVLAASAAYVWYCVLPLLFDWFAEFGGSDVIGFSTNFIYVFIASTIIFYLFVCWRQDRRLTTIIPLSAYSILFSYGF